MAKTDELIAARAKANANQWQPPPPDPEDRAIGEAGYFLQIMLQRLADAVDSITQDSDRTILVVDLGGKALTYFQYSDSNIACYARPEEVEPAALRKKLLGAIRYGKPFVLDMMSLELEYEYAAGRGAVLAEGALPSSYEPSPPHMSPPPPATCSAHRGRVLRCGAQHAGGSL